ncbi:HAMP domain-containing sensor histidine kinase [Sebaldella sp. S0638]|uniref:HAMP domain-containing sensor histidine kinase n=1 Tax=Sebaldella sp. S0638 TaxID=2957809 RepID=UPI0020A1FFEC|nr:HAMP domain-containing sensor histidine kinase [Sebaldella sp. S0638]MCP1223774.1 HAMP domain-containing histidine kinase [Sebaldella sp. S0638]
MKINKKIFSGYMVIFLITIIIGYLLGKYIFQEIYEFGKKTELRSHINNLTPDNITTGNLKNMEKKLKADIIAYDDNSEHNIKSKFENITVKKDGKEYIVILDNLSDDLNEKITFNMTKDITIIGYEIFGEGYIIPIRIIYNEKTYIDYEINQEIEKKHYTGLITLENAQLEAVSLRNTLKEDFLEMVLETYVQNRGFNESFQFTHKDPHDEKERYEVIVKKAGLKTVILVYSYKNVTVLFDELKSYFLYLIIIGLCLISVLTVLFTRIITSPILKISKITNKITKLNFEEKLDIKNKDEIGELASDINNLADTLGKTLKQLEEDKKNTKELMGNLSHEFKTPLTVISGYADLLEDDYDKKYLEIISEEVDRLTLLIEETTRAMSLDTKIVNLNMEVFDLKELVLNITEKFSVNVKDDIEVRNNLESSLVRADKNKLEQVIYNFISNALRHAKTYVEIELKKIDKKVIFYVRNDGKKLSDEEKEKIWLKFFKRDGENGRNSHRSGLGLYISRSILMLHESKHGVENTDDGVIFYFSLDEYTQKQDI